MGNLVEIHDLTVRFKDFAALKKVNGKITNRPGVKLLTDREWWV
ncbi:hypothetical protein [Pediococcus acidilactici]|nr:hypothetical protein [Pediococcus acidilactici]